ncbi:hypothetical protein B0H13DRAFT_1908915 [Mycena leptocephala]|nr:hypothetical protein B0H13DRAFT_1908915 [Mycena leptocephala]
MRLGAYAFCVCRVKAGALRFGFPTPLPAHSSSLTLASRLVCVFAWRRRGTARSEVSEVVRGQPYQHNELMCCLNKVHTATSIQPHLHSAAHTRSLARLSNFPSSLSPLSSTLFK